jgi:broad-specificity NMP kinase
MFDVCPGCGEYSEDKEILQTPTRARCKCGHEHPFRQLPTFFVTGASGSGKTTIALELQKSETDFIVLDQDILWNDAFNSGGADHSLFRNTWLRMIKNINQAGKPVILFGSTIPEQIESCPQRNYLSATHYLALVCDPTELTFRLRSRPSWRNSGTDENILRMIEFNDWLIQNACKTVPTITILDTAKADVSNSIEGIKAWYSKRF